MSTIQAHGSYLAPVTGTGPALEQPHHHGRRNALLAISGAALVLAGLAGVQYLRTQATEPAVTAASVTTVTVPHAAAAALEADVAGTADVLVVSAATVPTITVPHSASAALSADLAE